MAKPSPQQVAEERIEQARHSGARELDLSGLRLTALPDAIASLTALESLGLGLNPHFPDKLVNRCPEMEIML